MIVWILMISFRLDRPELMPFGDTVPCVPEIYSPNIHMLNSAWNMEIVEGPEDAALRVHRQLLRVSRPCAKVEEVLRARLLRVCADSLTVQDVVIPRVEIGRDDEH